MSALTKEQIEALYSLRVCNIALPPDELRALCDMALRSLEANRSAIRAIPDEPVRKLYLAPLQLIGGKTAELQVRFVSRENIKDKPTDANPTPIRVLLVGEIEAAQPVGTPQ